MNRRGMMSHTGRGPRARTRIAAAVAWAALFAIAHAGLSLAGSDERKGTGGATELRIPVGPRGNTLGPAAVSDASGIDALYFNPAGLASVEGTEAIFSHTRYIANMTLNYVAVGTHLSRVGSLALSAKMLSVGDIIVTTEDAPEGTGEILSPTFAVLGLTWARPFTDRVSFGATFGYLTERIANASAQGVAFDFGVQYATGWNGLKFGMAMKNFGSSMQFSGPDFEVSTRPPGSDPISSDRTFSASSASAEMPSYFSIGAAYDLVHRSDQRLAALAAFQNNNFVGDNVCGALEWSYRDLFAVRGSYYGTMHNLTDPTTASESSSSGAGDDLYSGVALGLGYRMKTGGSKLGVDLAWKPVRRFFDDVIEVGLKVGF
jgi:hypothetical protein